MPPLFTPYLTRTPARNVQVTSDANPKNDRSESSVAVNPRNPLDLVGSSKRFTEPGSYQFSLAAYSSSDRARHWAAPPLQLPYGADFTSDPVVCFDDIGTAYLMGLIWNNGPAPHEINFLGLAAYKSTDGGKTWSAPDIIYTQYADKQDIAGDTFWFSPHRGTVYAAWDGAGGIQFARTKDHGATWSGVRAGGVDQPVGSVIAPGNIASISVAPTGTVYVFYISNNLGTPGIGLVWSTDGGDTFTSPASPGAQVATGITVVPGTLPGGAFRLETIPTSCAGLSGTLVVAWPDHRNGRAEIFYRRSDDGGATWHGSPSGDLLTAALPSPTNQNDFMPQLAATGSGEIGCCFYEFGPKGGATPLIDIVTVVSLDRGATFDYRLTVTDQPWDPAIDAPTDEAGNKFIGDYFGFAAGPTSFFPFWTDTRTGVQEIFTSEVYLVWPHIPVPPASWAQILFGIIDDSGGVAVVGGHIIVVPPRGPEKAMLTSILVAELAKSIPGGQGAAIRKAAYRALANLANVAAKAASESDAEG